MKSSTFRARQKTLSKNLSSLTTSNQNTDRSKLCFQPMSLLSLLKVLIPPWTEAGLSLHPCLAGQVPSYLAGHLVL